jgi:hypothetical protein
MNIKIGDSVKFYDSIAAHIDRDYSGKEEKYYPIGKVINRYITPTVPLGDTGIILGGNDVVDIQLPDGRISQCHFTNGVTLI